MSASTRTLPDWARALGKPLFNATIRRQPSDFLVSENLAIEFSGTGEHDYLWLQKTGANTNWVARQLARHAGVRAADVGYAGLKDRHAITRQWFSILRSGDAADWPSFSCNGVEILDIRRHQRKLRRGAHDSNEFRIALRSDDALTPYRDRIEDRLECIATRGVPNYFGPQRFGHDASNIDLALQLFAGKRLKREMRSIAISAARSFLFNEILARRVSECTWDRILPGELANLDGSGSVFEVIEPDEVIERRCADMDIHPTATLCGLRSDISPGVVQELERDATDAYSDLKVGLERLAIKASTRPLRLRVKRLSWHFDDDALWLDFTLPKGGFATTVLREVARWSAS